MFKLKKIGFQIARKIKKQNIFGPIVKSGWEIDERLSLLPGHFVNYLVHRLELLRSQANVIFSPRIIYIQNKRGVRFMTSRARKVAGN